MHDDFLAELSAFRSGPAPEAGAELRALFASVATVETCATPAAEPARRLPVYKRILTGLPSKVAAGALGALLAGTVGAGALTGTMVLTSDDAPVVESQEQDQEHEAPEVEEAVVEASADEGDDAGKHEVPEDLSTVAVPTSVDEAAQNHAFDEACGNHGAYVSYFAQTGEEPSCATEARAAAAAGTGASDEVSAEAGEGEDDKAEAKEARTETRVERQAAKAGAEAKSARSGKGSR